MPNSEKHKIFIRYASQYFQIKQARFDTLKSIYIDQVDSLDKEFREWCASYIDLSDRIVKENNIDISEKVKSLFFEVSDFASQENEAMLKELIESSSSDKLESNVNLYQIGSQELLYSLSHLTNLFNREVISDIKENNVIFLFTGNKRK